MNQWSLLELKVYMFAGISVVSVYDSGPYSFNSRPKQLVPNPRRYTSASYMGAKSTAVDHYLAPAAARYTVSWVRSPFTM